MCSTVAARALYAAGQLFGVPLDDVLARHQLTVAELEDIDLRIPSQVEMDLMDTLAERTGQPALGVRLASLPPSVTFDLVDYVAMNAPNVEAGFRCAIRYSRLLNDGVGFELIVDPEAARLLHHPTPGVYISRHGVEAALGLYLQRARAMTGRAIVPRSVAFRTAAPDDVGPYTDLFRCPVAFAQPLTEMVFDREVLGYEVLRADDALYRILVRQAEERIVRLPSVSSPVDEVRREICRQLRGDVPKLDDVALRIGMSARNLQHQLQASGRTFQMLVDEVRLEMATTYLSDPRVKAIDVALLLGFSDASTFNRAFRRWTGTTPMEYRRTLLQRPNS